MRHWQNVDQWMRFQGAPVQVSQPDQWLKGPFFFDITLPAAGGLINILDSAVLNTDPQFNSTYGSVQNPEVVLHVDGLQLISADNVLRTATPADKETIWKQAEASFRKGQRNVNYPLGQTLKEMLGADWQGQAAAADAAPMTGFGPYRIPNSIEVNTINDAFTLPAFTTALAADIDLQLVVYGFIFPSKAYRDAAVVQGGGSCGPGDGVGDVEVATRQVLARPALLAGTGIGQDNPIKTRG